MKKIVLAIVLLFSILMNGVGVLAELQINPDGTFRQWSRETIGLNKSVNEIDFFKFKGKGVNVAIFDTGVDASHPDLKREDGTNVVKANINCVDFTDCVTSNDYDGYHGTMIAGLIAAQHNDIGVDGIAPNVNLYGVNVGFIDNEGTHLNLSAMEKGMKWIINTRKDASETNDIHIVNMSIGQNKDSWGDSYDTIYNLISEAFEIGILIVTSADNDGNENPYLSNCRDLPSKHPDVVTVGAINESEKRHLIEILDGSGNMRGSSTCAEMDIAAPGDELWSTYPISLESKEDTNIGYDIGGGTSYATPIVVGVLSLLKEMYPEDNNIESIAKLKSMAKNIGGYVDNDGNNWEFGSGLVQAKLYEEAISKSLDIMLKESTKLYEYPSIQANFTYSESKIYHINSIWKYDDVFDQYQWYRVQTETGDRWVNIKDSWKEIIPQRFLPASATVLYEMPSTNSSTFVYGLDETSIYSNYGYNWNLNEDRYDWYQINTSDGVKWFYKNYENYKTTLTRDGLTDGVITDWDDYISSTVIQEMKTDESTSERFANFEEQNLLTKNEYAEIMTKHATKYKKRYLIHAKKSTTGQQKLYFSFSDSELYFERPGSISYIKANDGSSFRIINPKDYYDQFYSDGSYTSYSDLFTFDQITFIPITDKSFFQSFQVHTLQQYYLHDEPNSTPLVSSVSPQTLNVVFQYKDWYQINTWLGLKWIHVPTGKLGSKAPTNVNQIITINGIAHAKEYPLENDITSFYVQDATYTTTKQYDDWYFIKREDGNYYWVRKDDVTLGNFTIRLTEQTDFYNQPNGVRESSLTPQDVIAYQRQGDWFEINTWLGKRWINPNNEIVVDAKTVSYPLALTKTYLLHDLPFDNKVLTSQVSPQTVNVKGEWVDTSGIKWLKIQTWLGDKWIKMN